MFENIRSDVKAFQDYTGGGITTYFYYPMFTATMIYRFAHWCYHHHFKLVAYLFTRLNDFLHGIWLGPRVEIGPGLVLGHARGLVVNPTTIIGKNCTILQNVTLGGPGIIIGDNVFISAGALIISRKHKGRQLVIGDNARIGAGAVVLNDVPSGAVMVGNPARNIRQLSTEVK